MARRRPGAPAVPTFSLYGEGEGDHVTDAEFVHIEDIRSRSHLYDWRIETHAHRGLYQIVLICDGSAIVRIDETESSVIGPAAITVAPGVVHGFAFSPQTRGYVLTIAAAQLFAGGSDRPGPSLEELLGHSGVIDLATTPADARRIETTLEQVLAEFRGAHDGRAAMLDWLVRCCLLLMIRRYAAVARASRSAGSREDVLARFRALIDEHYRDHWSVVRYAEALHITERRLNRICRSTVRRTALDLVQERLLLEARRRLVYIAVPVALLAEELGFKDPAYFSRFFKRMTGTAPNEFRQSARRAMGIT